MDITSVYSRCSTSEALARLTGVAPRAGLNRSLVPVDGRFLFVDMS